MRPLSLVRGDQSPARRSALDVMLDTIYEQHVADVHRWVRRLAGPQEDVEDLVHEVFLVAIRRRADFRGDGKIKTWLFRITGHVVKGRRGRDRVRRWLLNRHGDVLATERGATATPLEQMEKAEGAVRLYAALDKIPDRYRTPIILYEIDGMTGQEVADLVGVSLGAIWVRLHRGRARLFRELAKVEVR